MNGLPRRFWTKATAAEGDAIRYSPNWLLARRGFLRVTPDALECGGWRIPYREIDEAVLFSFQQGLIPGYILRVKSGGRTYQFGLNPRSYWEGELPFPVRRERVRLRNSRFSIAVRVVLIMYLAYLLWRRLR